MRLFVSVAATVALSTLTGVCWADPTPSDDRPSSGTGLLIGGGITTGIGALNFLTGAIECSSSLVSSDNKDLCYGISFGLGGAGLAIGVPMLIIGANKRAAYKEWLKEHPAVEGLSVVPLPGGGAVGYRAFF